MAYKNQKKNKAHIRELRNDPTNWRYKYRQRRNKTRKSSMQNELRLGLLDLLLSKRVAVV